MKALLAMVCFDYGVSNARMTVGVLPREISYRDLFSYVRFCWTNETKASPLLCRSTLSNEQSPYGSLYSVKSTQQTHEQCLNDLNWRLSKLLIQKVVNSCSLGVSCMNTKHRCGRLSWLVTTTPSLAQSHNGFVSPWATHSFTDKVFWYHPLPVLCSPTGLISHRPKTKVHLMWRMTINACL